MIQTGEKLKVFISSKTGDKQDCTKYNLARKAIKEILEATGLFQIYLFEETGTSSTSAVNHYIRNLRYADVCIFLIDNEDGVPEGVQNEVDEVLKNKIPSLYYFCDQNSREKTSLQKSLLHANAPKSKIIHSFEDFIERGAVDLINDILFTYKAYSSGDTIHPSNELLVDESDDENKIVKDEKISIPNIFLIGNKNISKEKCREYFINMFFESEKNQEEVSSDTDIDYYCSKFLQIMFEGVSYYTFEVSEYLKVLKTILPDNYFKIVKLRWKSIGEYYSNNLSESIETLKIAYKESVLNKLEEWFIQDILIDLRNQINLYYESRNEYTDQNYGQLELNKMGSIVFYPIIDRHEKNLLEQLEKDRQNIDIKGYSSKIFLGDRSLYTNSIADIFVEAMIFGSMTHLIHLYSNIQNLSYEWFVRNDEWSMFKLNFKNAIMSLDKKKVHRTAIKFANHVEKLTQEEAREIYDYTENQIISHKKLTAQLLAISEIGYYLNDSDFSIIWGGIKKQLDSWKNSETGIVNQESYIFNAFRRIAERVDQNYLIEFCLSILKSESVRYHNSAIKFLVNSVNYSDANSTIIAELNKYVIDFLEENANSTEKYYVKLLCCQLGKILDEEEIQKLNSKIQEKWPEFYKMEYLVETNRDDTIDALFLENQLKTIEFRNENQGKNGTYSRYVDSPFYSIINVLSIEGTIISSKQIDRIFTATSNTILDPKQTVDDKIQAYKLLYTLCRIDKDIIKRSTQIVEKLSNVEENIDAFESMMSHVQKQMLLFAHYLLLDLLQKDIWILILNELSTYDDEGSQIEACKLINSYLKHGGETETSRSLLGLFFQFSLIWSNSESLDLRWNSIHLLLKLLNIKEYKDAISNKFIRIINEDNSYVKSRLVHGLDKIAKVDIKTAKYILERSLSDSNYVIRKLALSKKYILND